MSISVSDVETILLLSSRVSGSIGDRTFSRNAAGPYVKTRTIPTNPDTPTQSIMRRRFRNLTRLWAGALTETERLGWNVYARNVPVRNRLARERHITGFQHYIRSNYTRMRWNFTRIDTPPRIFNLGEFTPFEVRIETPPLRFLIQWNTADNWTGEPMARAFVSITSPYPPAIRSFKPPYIFWAALPGIPPPPRTLNPPIGAILGDTIFGKVQVQRADGRMSYVQRITTHVVTAD
jgi:hypothetical protein